MKCGHKKRNPFYLDRIMGRICLIVLWEACPIFACHRAKVLELFTVEFMVGSMVRELVD